MDSTACRTPLPNTRPRPTKLAVCLVGFVRTLDRVHTSIRNSFAGTGAAVDYFGVVASGGSHGHEQDTAKGQYAGVAHTALAPALSSLRPIAWVDEDIAPALRTPTAVHGCGLACMRQFDRLHECGELVRQEESLCRRKYDWVREH